MVKRCTIYGIHETDKPHEIRYIGQTKGDVQKRLKSHFVHANHSMRKTPLAKWLKTKKRESVNIKIIRVNAKWNTAEVETIKKFKKMGARLLNVTAGGQGHFGTKLSTETKQKISKAMLGQVRTKLHAKNISKGLTGKKLSQSHIHSLRVSHLGQVPVNKGTKLTKQERNRISILRGQKPFTLVDTETNKSIGQWCNASECARELGISRTSITNALTGWSSNVAHGFLIKYVGAKT